MEGGRYGEIAHLEGESGGRKVMEGGRYGEIAHLEGESGGDFPLPPLKEVDGHAPEGHARGERGERRRAVESWQEDLRGEAECGELQAKERQLRRVGEDRRRCEGVGGPEVVDGEAVRCERRHLCMGGEGEVVAVVSCE